MKIITAMNNPKLNEELKNEKNIEILYKDIFYKEGILEILEKEINIDYIIINYKLPGEIKLNNLIEKINEKNEKIKIIILIKKENKNNFYKIKKEKNNTEKNIEIIKDLKNKNIIRIFYNNEINMSELKNYNKIKENKIKNQNKNIKEKTIIFLGEKQVGKSMTILGIVKKLEQEDKKVLILELNKNKSDFSIILKKRKKRINKKRKIKNNYKQLKEKYYNKKSNLKIINKIIKKINKNIDIISNNKIINLNILKKIEKNYDYIFIEINSEKNNIKIKKILEYFNKKILIIKPNLLGIKHSKQIIEKNKINNFNIIINNNNIHSVDENIIKNIFNKKIILKINYNKKYDQIINNNFNISKNNLIKI